MSKAYKMLVKVQRDSLITSSIYEAIAQSAVEAIEQLSETLDQLFMGSNVHYEITFVDLR